VVNFVLCGLEVWPGERHKKIDPVASLHLEILELFILVFFCMTHSIASPIAPLALQFQMMTVTDFTIFYIEDLDRKLVHFSFVMTV
jgi:hypothetical protein